MDLGSIGLGIKMQANFTIDWKELDLSRVTEWEEQVRRIKSWGGVKVYGCTDR